MSESFRSNEPLAKSTAVMMAQAIRGAGFSRFSRISDDPERLRTLASAIALRPRGRLLATAVCAFADGMDWFKVAAGENGEAPSHPRRRHAHAIARSWFGVCKQVLREARRARLHVFEISGGGEDIVIAYDAEDARAIMLEIVDAADLEMVGFRQYRDDEDFEFHVTVDEEVDPITKTCGEWARAKGRGYFAHNLMRADK